VGTGANATNGGELIEGTSFKVKFQVQAKANVSVVNTARMIGWNQPLTQSFFDDASAALPGDQAPLAVKLLYFNGKVIGNQVQLEWKVAAEQQTDYYLIERSTDGRNFVKAGRVNSNRSDKTESIYRFTDPSTDPSVAVFYRVREVDLNGKLSESGILKLSGNLESNRFAIMGQNPVNGFVNVQATLKNNTPLMLRIMASNGFVIYSQTLSGQKGTNLYRIELNGIRNGMYILELSDGTTRQTFKFVRQ
jgi:hypothetical protein